MQNSIDILEDVHMGDFGIFGRNCETFSRANSVMFSQRSPWGEVNSSVFRCSG